MSDVRLLSVLTSRRFAKKLAASTGMFRVVAGTALLARPELLAQLLGVDSVTARRVAWLGRLLAGRETALGLGTLHAVGTRRPPRPWLLAQALSDTTDAAALLLAARARQISVPRALPLVALATAGALGEILAGRATHDT